MLHESTRAYVIINVSGAFSACFYEIALVFLVCRIPHCRIPSCPLVWILKFTNAIVIKRVSSQGTLYFPRLFIVNFMTEKRQSISIF